MGWIRGLLAAVWQIARAIAPVMADGWRKPPLYLLLLTFFLIVGAVLVLVGVNLDDADRWLDRQSGWLEKLGSFALRVVFGVVLMLCAVAIGMGLYQRLPFRAARRDSATQAGKGKRTRSQESAGRIGWGAMLLALIIGYFAWIGTFGRY